jgi:hypothetical protein
MENQPSRPESHVQHRPASSKIADSLSNRFCRSHRGSASRIPVVRIAVGFERRVGFWSAQCDPILSPQATSTQNRRVLSIRIFIKVISEQAAFSTINGALEIRISAMLESTRRRSEMLQSPEARVHDLRGATPVLIHEQKVWQISSRRASTPRCI